MKRYLLLASLVALCSVSTASAVPVIYSVVGTLDDLDGGASDPINLHGAKVTITFPLDTTNTPIWTTSGSGFTQHEWAAPLVFYSFTGRPNGSPDFSVTIAHEVGFVNAFSPNPDPGDQFYLDSHGVAGTMIDGELASLPGAWLYFTDQNFFPGTGFPTLPQFNPANIGSLGGGRPAL